MSRNALRVVWAEHCRAEFELRDVDATMRTMTDDPHLVNVPTGRGGQGREAVRRFYVEEFVGPMPDDARIESLGLAVGTTPIVEEVVLSFTHDRQMDWILPDLPPTGRQVRIPQIAVVGFRDDKVHFEHIWWDQASVLAQLDLLQPMDVPVLRAEEADRIVEFGDPGD